MIGSDSKVELLPECVALLDQGNLIAAVIIGSVVFGYFYRGAH